ncbi:MAG: SIR2 family protein [Candidatus Solibacter sp.]
MSANLPPSPYRGLEPFDENDAPFFFGRERETRLIAASLFASPLTLLYGASGVGKSSVLRAGVLPRMRGRQDVLPIMFPAIVDDTRVRGWQSDPLGGIKETVAVALYKSVGEDRKLYAQYQDAVLAHEMSPLREYLTACHLACGRRLMLILDQFEEYSLYHAVDDEFGRQFPLAITPGDLSVSFLISLREDSLSKLDRFKGRIPTLWDSYRRIDHLDQKAGEDAIRLPLGEYNSRHPEAPPVSIENELVQAILAKVQAGSVKFEATGSGAVAAPADSEGRIETPYLQLVLMRLWEREMAEGGNTLRLETYNAEGGAAKIVHTHLDRVMEQFTPEEQDAAARVFSRLVTPSGAKIAFDAKDLAEYEHIDPKVLGPILARLEEGSRRILRRVASPHSVSDQPRYEIFHDRLSEAILSWRAKRLQEQERERRQREDAAQKRVSEETKASFRKTVNVAMNRIGNDGRMLWTRILPYLVSGGKRLIQTNQTLADLTEQPLGAVTSLLGQLLELHLLRAAYQSKDGAMALEVPDDAIAAALLEWHTEYVAQRTQQTAQAGLAVAATVVDIIGKAAEEAREFPYDLVRDQLHKARMIPFLGAGVSRSADPPVPSGYEMKTTLANACDFPTGEFEQSDIAEIASYFVQRLGREELDNLLQHSLGAVHSTPSKTHQLLAALAQHSPIAILTTNFDTLMEQALDALRVPYDTLSYVGRRNAGLNSLLFTRYGEMTPQPLTRGFTPTANRALVFRLNGPAFFQGTRTGSYALTEEDNIDWIVNFEKVRPDFFDSFLTASPLLSLGHSARDWSQRTLLRALHEMRRDGPRSMAVAVNPSPLSVMTWQRYEVDFYNLDLDAWATRMAGPAMA